MTCTCIFKFKKPLSIKQKRSRKIHRTKKSPDNIRMVLFVNISADIYSNAPFDKKKGIGKISGLFDVKTKIRKIGCYFKKKASSYHSEYFFYRYF